MARVKLQIPGGGATPGPPVATQIASRGVNARDFCTEFNARTQNQKGKLLRVIVDIADDKSFTMTLKGEPTVKLIKEALNIKKGSSEPNRNKVGKLTQAAIDKILDTMGDNLQGFTKEAKQNIIAGTARSMGVEIEK